MKRSAEKHRSLKRKMSPPLKGKGRFFCEERPGIIVLVTVHPCYDGKGIPNVGNLSSGPLENKEEGGIHGQ